MTKIKLCGLMRAEDIEAANEIRPDFVGFVFWGKSHRSVSRDKASELKKMLDPAVKAVGVFVDEDINVVKSLLAGGIIDIAQLHGSEDDGYIRELQESTGKAVIKAFKVRSKDEVKMAEQSPADYILLDSGAGTGVAFDWKLLEDAGRPYFLAGGLGVDNVAEAVRSLHPYAVDVSSGIETDKVKDVKKMAAFAAAVRKEDNT
ncbi:MAG: phosphoribosylanthranilate isomerase [Clostridiales bacterium]|nr:phosphoribosylanthranilate isomerase [Clostridiales bacterium]